MVAPAQTPKKPPRGIKQSTAVIVGGALFLLLALGASILALSPSDDAPEKPAADVLQQTQTTCDADASGTRLEDGGATLRIDSTGNKDKTGISLTTLECILEHTNVPDQVMRQMFATEPADGRQEGSWPGFDATWTYTPDEGLDLTIARTT